MIDHAFAARDVKRLLDATNMSGGKPVLLVGSQEDRRLTMAALARDVDTMPVNLNFRLSQILLEDGGAPLDHSAVIASMEPSSAVLLLDRIQLLMLPQLRINPVDVLCRVARRRAVCASWPGQLECGRLSYANRDHPEYLDEDAGRALVLDLSNQGTFQ